MTAKRHHMQFRSTKSEARCLSNCKSFEIVNPKISSTIISNFSLKNRQSEMDGIRNGGQPNVEEYFTSYEDLEVNFKKVNTVYSEMYFKLAH